MLPNFVAKVTVDRADCLRSEGRPVIEAFAALRSALVAAAGRDVASLFAEPIVTPKGDRVEVAYYGEQAGDPVPIARLDPDARRVVVDKLRNRLAALAPLLGSPLAPLLSRALYVADGDDVLAVGAEPLLIRWGMLPPGVHPDDREAQRAHFAATLGPYAAFGAPAIAPESGQVAAASAAPARVLRDGPRQGGRALAAGSGGLAIATAVAALVAVLLALPGVLSSPATGSGGDAVGLPDARRISRAMQDKVDQARASLKGATCKPDGSIDAGPRTGRQGQLPPSPIPLTPALTQTQGDLALVARRATESVVFMINCTDRPSWEAQHKDDKDKGSPIACPNPGSGGNGAASHTEDLVIASTGSGFFIAPKLVVTNSHVVRDAKAMFVTSRFLGRVTPARVEAATVKVEAADSDFAVVSLDVATSPPPIELTTSASRLQNVVAAGFPGVIIHEDAQLARLLKGDNAAAPELTTFPGFITLTMNQDQAVPLIFSSAVIGHGNSGGPLLDLCARAIGVNTLGWSGDAEDTGYKVNVAEGAKALADFLEQHHVAHRVSTSGCEPGPQAGTGPVTPPAPAPPAPPPGSPPPAAPPGQGR